MLSDDDGRGNTGADHLNEPIKRALAKRTNRPRGDDAAHGPQDPSDDEGGGRSETPWPSLDPAALTGLAGEIVRFIAPQTEADPVAILVQLLVAFGSCITTAPHWRVEAARHAGNLFVVLVGRSAMARKGTSWGYVWRLFEMIDSDWTRTRVMSGLSSGEGLLHSIRDASHVVDAKGQADPGVTDKRLLALEPEFASVLKVLGREGNTLSAHIRNAWDGNRLQTLTRASPLCVTDPHVSVIGHITDDEFRRYLSTTEAGNGFANRFMLFAVRRARVLPFGGNLDERRLAALAERLGAAVKGARVAAEIGLDDEAREPWVAAYHELTADLPGMLGALTSRAATQARRVAMLYALLANARSVSVEHLQAGLAVVRYSIASTAMIFGASLGDPTADKILAALGRAPDGLTRTEIRDVLGRHAQAADVERALGLLLRCRRARTAQRPGQGRPAEVWHATKAT